MAVDFTAWLQDTTAIRCILVESVSNISGVNTTHYLSTKAYIDEANNRVYDPIVSANSIQLIERMSIDSSPSMSFGDVEIVNIDGTLDSWLTDIWANKAINIYVGDVRWLRSDFVKIFSGTTEDVDSRSAQTLNIKVRDKLQRLNTPISETKLGGSTANKNEIIPLCFGECFNVSPLLSNPATLEFQTHQGAIEGAIEVRDNGVPVGFSYTESSVKSRFKLTAQPFGKVTASVQGVVKNKNLIPHSEQFDNAGWSKTGITVTANNVAAPDGTVTADKITATLADSYINSLITVTSSTTYTFSVWLRADSSITIRIYLGNQNGAAGSQPLTVDVATAWKRFQVTHATSSTTTVLFAQVGGGSHFNFGEVVYAWGAQLELGNVANSYAATQGVPANIFLKNVAGIVRNLVLNYGNANTRFVPSDLDIDSIQTFEEANPQPVGLYVESRENTLSVCNQIASSVGAQLVMSRLGKLQLLKLELPAPGTPFEIGKDDIFENTISISRKLPVKAAFKVNYNKNWTVQPGLLTGIPESHKKIYATEYASVTVEDVTVKSNYALDSEPIAIDTLLLTESDASDEANRLLDLYKTPRFVITFTGKPRLVELILGQPVTLTYPRFGLDSGKDGQVIGLSIDWSNLSVKVEALV